MAAPSSCATVSLCVFLPIVLISISPAFGSVGTEDGTKRMQIKGNDEHKGEEWIDVLGWSGDKTVTIGDDVSPIPDT